MVEFNVLLAVLFVIWTFVQLSNCPFVRIFIYSNSRRALRITDIYVELGHLCGKRGNTLLSTYFLCLLQGHKKTASEQSTVNRGVLGGCTHHRPRVELFGRPPPSQWTCFATSLGDYRCACISVHCVVKTIMTDCSRLAYLL